MKSKEIALGGIMVALSTLILYLSAIIPISTIAILTVASAIIPVCIIRTNLKTSIVVYVASSLLSFFIAPINIAVLYTLFFGVYGIIKYLVEKKHNRTIEIILKLIFFNIAFIIGFIIIQKVLGINVALGLEQLITSFIDEGGKIVSFIVLWIIAQPIFLVYDYALTLIISFYMERIHKK